MAASTAKKRSRSTDGIGSSRYQSSFPPSVVMPSHTDKEAEYERAVAFLQSFHSRRVAVLAPTSTSPLGAISEVGIGDLVDDFSMALQVDSPKALKSFSRCESSSSLSRSPRIKKTTTSTCLLDLATTPTVSNKTSNNKVTEEKGADDSSLYYLHQQSRDDIFSESCSSTSDFGVGYLAGNKRHCSNLIR